MFVFRAGKVFKTMLCAPRFKFLKWMRIDVVRPESHSNTFFVLVWDSRKQLPLIYFFLMKEKHTIMKPRFFLFFKKWPLGWSRATVMMMQCPAVAVILESIPRWWIPVSVAGNMFMCRVLVSPCRITRMDNFSVVKHILYKHLFLTFLDAFSIFSVWTYS